MESGTEYSAQGRWEEAVELATQALEIGRKLLGDEHPDTLASESSLLEIYCWQGLGYRPIDDVGLLEAAKRILGDEHSP